MRVAVVAPSPVPFTLGGAERAWNGIVRAVNDRSEHACELLKIPTPETDLSELIAGYRRFARLDVAHFDRVISSKYPAWLAPHDDHLIYLFHRLRGLYDTYPPGRGLRADVRERRLSPLLRVLRAPPRRDEVDRALTNPLRYLGDEAYATANVEEFQAGNDARAFAGLGYNLLMRGPMKLGRWISPDGRRRDDHTDAKKETTDK